MRDWLTGLLRADMQLWSAQADILQTPSGRASKSTKPYIISVSCHKTRACFWTLVIHVSCPERRGRVTCHHLPHKPAAKAAVVDGIPVCSGAICLKPQRWPWAHISVTCPHCRRMWTDSIVRCNLGFHMTRMYVVCWFCKTKWACVNKRACFWLSTNGPRDVK